MKNQIRKLKTAMFLMAITLLLAACVGGAAEPTTDPNIVFTEVAETVMVSITQTAQAMPTNTPQPTPTSEPTPFPTSTIDITIPTTAPIIPGESTPTTQLYGDRATWTAQSPMDGKTFKPHESFTFHGCWNNVGTTTWNKNYKMVWVPGSTQLWAGQTTWNPPFEVPPGKNWCPDLPSITPYEPGKHITRWYLKTDRDIYIWEAYFNFRVE